MTQQKIKFYSSWFCPFAQRAWIALKEKNVDFEYIEIDPYNKTAEWLAVNPRGLVPTIVDERGRSIYESSVCIEFVDEMWTGDKKLLPGDAYARAQQRIWGDHVTKKVLPPFYGLLMKKSETERQEAVEQLLASLRQLFREFPHGENNGPFLAGEKLTYIDIMVAPFALRIDNVLHHYRQFSIPKTGEWERYHRWIQAARAHPSVKATLAEDEKLISAYARYADNTAQSLVADAIRKGGVLP